MATTQIKKDLEDVYATVMKAKEDLVHICNYLAAAVRDDKDIDIPEVEKLIRSCELDVQRLDRRIRDANAQIATYSKNVAAKFARGVLQPKVAQNRKDLKLLMQYAATTNDAVKSGLESAEHFLFLAKTHR